MFVKTILFPLSGRGTERWSPQKSYFDLLSLFHIELQHTNSLRAPSLQYSLYHWPTRGTFSQVVTTLHAILQTQYLSL